MYEWLIHTVKVVNLNSVGLEVWFWKVNIIFFPPEKQFWI